MHKSNGTLSRRNLIKGLGAAGILSGFNINKALAATSNLAPTRVLLVAIQHGWGICHDANRSMIETENDFSFPPGLEPFNSIKQHATVVNGVLGLGEWGNNHDLSYADMFTAGVLQGEENSSFSQVMPLSTTPSLDYLIQQHSGMPTFRFSAGYRSWGLSHNPLSFDGNSNVLPFHTDALDAYNSFFKSDNVSSSSPEAIKEAEFISNLFSAVQQTANKDLTRLSPSEQEKLNNYLTSIDLLKAKKQSTQTYSGNLSLSKVPTQNQSKSENLVDFLEMTKVGFANNMTTSAVLGIGELNSIPDFHHTHAHEMTDSYWDTRAINAQYITNFVNELANIEDMDGNTLLDNTIIVLSGEVASGEHNILSKGHIIFGGGGFDSSGNRRLNPGRLVKPGLHNRTDARQLTREDINGALQTQIRWSSTASKRTNADLLREIGNMAGLSLNEFGLPSQNRGDVL